MKKIRLVKESARKNALSQGVQTRELKEPVGRGKFRVINPMRLIERRAVKEFKNMDWKRRSVEYLTIEKEKDNIREN